MTQAQLFHDFIVNEVWADHCEPATGGGIVLYMSAHYDEFHNAYTTAEYCGAHAARADDTDELDGPATVARLEENRERCGAA